MKSPQRVSQASPVTPPATSSQREKRRRALRFLLGAMPGVAASITIEPNTAHAYMGEQLLNQASTFFIGPLFVLSIVFAGVGALFNAQYARVAVYSAIICAGVFTFIKAAPTLMTAVQA